MREWIPAYQAAELATIAISVQQGLIPNIPPPPLAIVAVQAEFEHRVASFDEKKNGEAVVDPEPPATSRTPVRGDPSRGPRPYSCAASQAAQAGRRPPYPLPPPPQHPPLPAPRSSPRRLAHTRWRYPLRFSRLQPRRACPKRHPRPSRRNPPAVVARPQPAAPKPRINRPSASHPERAPPSRPSASPPTPAPAPHLRPASDPGPRPPTSVPALRPRPRLPSPPWRRPRPLRRPLPPPNPSPFNRQLPRCRRKRVDAPLPFTGPKVIELPAAPAKPSLAHPPAHVHANRTPRTTARRARWPPFARCRSFRAAATRRAARSPRLTRKGAANPPPMPPPPPACPSFPRPRPKALLDGRVGPHCRHPRVSLEQPPPLVPFIGNWDATPASPRRLGRPHPPADAGASSATPPQDLPAFPARRDPSRRPRR